MPSVALKACGVGDAVEPPLMARVLIVDEKRGKDVLEAGGGGRNPFVKCEEWIPGKGGALGFMGMEVRRLVVRFKLEFHLAVAFPGECPTGTAAVVLVVMVLCR